jgi:hypothetical protein
VKHHCSRNYRRRSLRWTSTFRNFHPTKSESLENHKSKSEEKEWDSLVLITIVYIISGSGGMNPRTKSLLQRVLAVALYIVGMLIVVLAFLPLQYPDWWPKIAVTLPSVDIPWWPVVTGIGAASHYSARIFLTVAFGLTIFLPTVETTFVSIMRRQSPMGAPFVDRRDFTCPVCGTVNRASVQFCVKCGSQISSGTRHWAQPQPRQRTGLASGLKVSLSIAAGLAFFLGIFDLTAYSTITGYLGTDAGTVFAATILSSVPSIAGYIALKEGPLRKYGSLKGFDKLVFGDVIWVLFALLFFAFAAITLLGPGITLIGTMVVLAMQVLLGALLLLHPILRKSISRPVTMAYT